MHQAGKLSSCSTVASVPCAVIFQAADRGLWAVASRSVRASAEGKKENGMGKTLRGLDQLMAPDKPKAEKEKLENLQNDRDNVLRLGKARPRQTISGRRVLQQRQSDEFDDFLDIGMRFEGAKSLFRAIRLGGMGDINEVRPGQLVVAMEDKPALRLVKGQVYEVLRVYYQRRGTISSKGRVEVTKVGAPPPKAFSKNEVWDKWCELYSEEYHSAPVRCELDDLKLRSVGNEVGEALSIALPVALIPLGTLALYGALTSDGDWCLLGPLLGHC